MTVAQNSDGTWAVIDNEGIDFDDSAPSPAVGGVN